MARIFDVIEYPNEMKDEIVHLIRVFNDVKNSSHGMSPLKVITISL